MAIEVGLGAWAEVGGWRLTYPSCLYDESPVQAPTQAQGTCWLVNTLMCLEGNVLGRRGPRGEDPEALQAGPPQTSPLVGPGSCPLG